MRKESVRREERIGREMEWERRKGGKGEEGDARGK